MSFWCRTSEWASPASVFRETSANDFGGSSHYDHLDVLSMQTIGNKATWFVPKGLKQLMLDNDIREDRVVEHE